MKDPIKEKDIDYENQIFHGKFERQAPDQQNSKPITEKYWVCCVNPKLSTKLMAFIKGNYQYTGERLRHLKRVLKITNEDKSILLKIIICPIQEIDEDVLHSNLAVTIGPEFSLETHDIPMNKPIDKETNIVWSNKYWPLVWKGNPLIQDLNELYRNFNVENVTKYMNQIIRLSNEQEKSPIVVMFVDPSTDTIKSITFDSRTPQDPMKHPVMAAIEEIAQQEVERRKQSESQDRSKNNYLCLNYHVYMTHEPCAMCSMALVHSRISQLIYLNQSPKTGAIDKSSGDKYMIHLSCTLNWKFEAYHMISNEKLVKDIGNNELNV